MPSFPYAGIFAFLSTPSARRATNGAQIFGAMGNISIHALREEGDFIGRRIVPVTGISIHALREEGDFFGFPRRNETIVFLSTPSARRATPWPAGQS